MFLEGRRSMKILIAYATRHGTTEVAAKMLASHLKNHEVDILRISRGFCVDTDKYDLMIFGSNIRMAKISRELSQYLKKNEAVLEGKRCGYFLCCGFVDCFEDYIQKNIPGSLLNSAQACACFGGSLEVGDAKGLDRFIISAVRSNILGGGANGQERDDVCLPTVLEGNIAQFADAVTGKYRQ